MRNEIIKTIKPYSFIEYRENVLYHTALLLNIGDRMFHRSCYANVILICYCNVVFKKIKHK